MSEALAPKLEKLPADAWARAGAVMNDDHFNKRGRISQAELDRLQAEYLAAGGEIELIQIGVTGENNNQFNGRVVNRNASKFSQAEREAHAKAGSRAPAPTPGQVWNNPGRHATRQAAEAAA
jgi:hypothetical protein